MAKTAIRAGLTVRIRSEDGLASLGFAILLSGEIEGLASAHVAADATIGWKPQIIMDGKELPFSKENALALYRRHHFILQQIVKAAK